MVRKPVAIALLIVKLVSVALCAGVVDSRAAVTAEVSGTHASSSPARETTNMVKIASFGESLGSSLERRGMATGSLCDKKDALSQRILREYGAIFLASKDVLLPPTCIFTSAEQVASFQSEAQIVAVNMNGVTIELQSAAMRALLTARQEALAEGLDITPRDGPEAARRDYADTVRLWNTRFLPALEHWERQGRLTSKDAERLKALPLREQVSAVLTLERRGIFFSRDFSKSILYSVAAPGASQHLSLLAFDVNEYADERVHKILARHGWFRTVRNDAPHFTYLGLPQELLPSYGLKKIRTEEGRFWVPNVYDRRRGRAREAQPQLAGLQ